MNLTLLFLTLSSMMLVISKVTQASPPHRSRYRRENCPDCSAPATPSCLVERAERIRAVSLAVPLSTSSRDFIPTCRPDGSFAPVQCHPSTKSCWCVTESGKPISGSAVLSNSRMKPNCSKYHRTAKSATKRRSSQAKKNRKMCNHGDRTQFNSGLVRTFRSEFNRIKTFSSLPITYRDSDSNLDEVVLSWKFEHLDRNGDGLLVRNETAGMKRLVRAHIPPRQCAKNFIKFCAKDDGKITKKEWLECLNVALIENREAKNPTRVHQHVHQHQQQQQQQNNRSPFLQLRPVSPTPTISSEHRSRDYPTLPLHSSSMLNSKAQVTELTGCRMDRQSALESQKHGLNASIIPECTPTGLYQKTQCAQGRVYCWCVSEDTGLQIPNSIVVNSSPDCDRNVLAKSMKGCMGPKRQKFMIDLMDQLRIDMDMANKGPKGRASGSNDEWKEQVAKWHFHRLDTSNNGMLERREWRVFRNETSTDKRLRRCGKNLPRHCDVNGDRRITLIEWTECLGARTLVNPTARKLVRTSNGPRSGKNPFTTILNRR